MLWVFIASICCDLVRIGKADGFIKRQFWTRNYSALSKAASSTEWDYLS